MALSAAADEISVRRVGANGDGAIKLAPPLSDSGAIGVSVICAYPHPNLPPQGGKEYNSRVSTPRRHPALKKSEYAPSAPLWDRWHGGTALVLVDHSQKSAHRAPVCHQRSYRQYPRQGERVGRARVPWPCRWRGTVRSRGPEGCGSPPHSGE